MIPRSIYIAGPVSGKVAYNFPAFDEADRVLTAQGWIVQSPAELAEEYCAEHGVSLSDLADNTFGDLDKLMVSELNIVKQCDAIYLLNGWEKSVGACKELVVAINNGLEIILEPEGGVHE